VVVVTVVETGMVVVATVAVVVVAAVVVVVVTVVVVAAVVAVTDGVSAVGAPHPASRVTAHTIAISAAIRFISYPSVKFGYRYCSKNSPFLQSL
jgi:hypothetical protein